MTSFSGNSAPHSIASTNMEPSGPEHRYVCMDLYIQPINFRRVVELGWTPVYCVASGSGTRESNNGIILIDHRPEHSYMIDSKPVIQAVVHTCTNLGLQPNNYGLAATTDPKHVMGLRQEHNLGSLMSISETKVPCHLSPADGSFRCEVRVYPLGNEQTLLIPPMQASALSMTQEGKPPADSYNFHTEEDVAAIMAPSLVEQQNAMRQRLKGITDRGRICKELRNAVPSHLKKRKNRRAVIKTLQDLEEFMGSIDPVFEECGSSAEFSMAAARTIGLSSTRFTELRRMWEAYQAEVQAENHEVMELAPQKDACTLRKLVAILERYGWSCTSAQPRSSEDISRPPRPPTVIENPSWLGALRKRSSASGLGGFDSDEYGSDYSPKKARSDYCSSEDGNTSDEGEVFAVQDPMISALFEPKQTSQSFMEDNFFLPTWTPRDSSSSDPPNITFDVPDVDLFNEIERQILSDFM